MDNHLKLLEQKIEQSSTNDVNLSEYEQRAAVVRAEYIQKFNEIDNVIRNVQSPIQREVLERRYLLYQHWGQIAEEMHYSERHVFRVHNAALQQLKDVIECQLP
jgi:DNA-directed RNA polymerase specialized sigma subunit